MCNFQQITTEQQKRADAGRKLVKKIKAKDGAWSCEGSGKKPYTVTLDRCSCGDFIRHHEPCKHMFALAFKLNKI